MFSKKTMKIERSLDKVEFVIKKRNWIILIGSLLTYGIFHMLALFFLLSSVIIRSLDYLAVPIAILVITFIQVRMYAIKYHGRERVVIRKNEIQVKRGFLWMIWREKYNVSEIRNLRLIEKEQSLINRFIGLLTSRRSHLMFDYRWKVIPIGIYLNLEESNQLYQEIERTITHKSKT